MDVLDWNRHRRGAVVVGTPLGQSRYLTHVKLASYNVNEVLAPLLFGFTLADVLLRWVLV